MPQIPCTASRRSRPCHVLPDVNTRAETRSNTKRTHQNVSKDVRIHKPNSQLRYTESGVHKHPQIHVDGPTAARPGDDHRPRTHETHARRRYGSYGAHGGGSAAQHARMVAAGPALCRRAAAGPVRARNQLSTERSCMGSRRRSSCMGWRLALILGQNELAHQVTHAEARHRSDGDEAVAIFGLSIVKVGRAKWHSSRGDAARRGKAEVAVHVLCTVVPAENRRRCRFDETLRRSVVKGSA